MNDEQNAIAKGDLIMVGNTSSQFSATKKMFLSSIFSHTKFPLTYSVWVQLPEDLKAAALYVNFYREITLAWQWFVNNKCANVSTDDAVGYVLDKLEANVAIMTSDKKRFSPKYIYRISWNCICEKTRNKCNIERYNSEESNYHFDPSSGELLDWFDILPQNSELDNLDEYETALAKEALWTIIEGMGPKALKVADHLINGSSLRKSHKNDGDILADVFVTADEYTFIVTELKKNIAPLGFVWGY